MKSSNALITVKKAREYKEEQWENVQVQCDREQKCYHQGANKH